MASFVGVSQNQRSYPNPLRFDHGLRTFWRDTWGAVWLADVWPCQQVSRDTGRISSAPVAPTHRQNFSVCYRGGCFIADGKKGLDTGSLASGEHCTRCSVLTLLRCGAVWCQMAPGQIDEVATRVGECGGYPARGFFSKLTPWVKETRPEFLCCSHRARPVTRIGLYCVRGFREDSIMPPVKGVSEL